MSTVRGTKLDLNMQQLKGLCAALLVIGLGSSLLEGARMHCDDSTECPEDHCCLTGSTSMCLEVTMKLLKLK